MKSEFLINYFHIKEDFTPDKGGERHILTGIAKIATIVLSLGIFPAVIAFCKKLQWIDPYPKVSRNQFNPSTSPSTSASASAKFVESATTSVIKDKANQNHTSETPENPQSKSKPHSKDEEYRHDLKQIAGELPDPGKQPEPPDEAKRMRQVALEISSPKLGIEHLKDLKEGEGIQLQFTRDQLKSLEADPHLFISRLANALNHENVVSIRLGDSSSITLKRILNPELDTWRTDDDAALKTIQDRLSKLEIAKEDLIEKQIGRIREKTFTPDFSDPNLTSILILETLSKPYTSRTLEEIRDRCTLFGIRGSQAKHVYQEFARVIEERNVPLGPLFTDVDAIIDFTIKYQLKHLNLAFLTLTPKHLAKLASEAPNITFLFFLRSKIDSAEGGLPAFAAELAKLKNLTSLYLGDILIGSTPGVAPAFAAELAKLTKLESLGLWGNSIGGISKEASAVATELANLKNLTYLNLQSNKICLHAGEALAVALQLIKLKKIRYVNLTDNLTLALSEQEKQEIHDLFSREVPECILWL